MVPERPTTYLTAEELHRIAKDKFDKAKAALPGPKREQMLASAYAYLSLADMKLWTSSRDLQPPK
jgi:hypothetical protein